MVVPTVGMLGVLKVVQLACTMAVCWAASRAFSMVAR